MTKKTSKPAELSETDLDQAKTSAAKGGNDNIEVKDTSLIDTTIFASAGGLGTTRIVEKGKPDGSKR